MGEVDGENVGWSVGWVVGWIVSISPIISRIWLFPESITKTNVPFDAISIPWGS